MDATVESMDTSTDKAPEEISKAVASLPAEQMFELMKQMKMCIENNPQEARNLLLQNPQLAYALLQAQVIMRIVDPKVAVKILNRPVAPAGIPDAKVNEPAPQPASLASEGPLPFSQAKAALSPPGVSLPGMPLPPIPNQFADQDLRTMADQDLRQLPVLGDRDMRAPPVLIAGDKDMRHPMGDQDFRIPESRPFDPRFRGFERSRPVNLDPRTAYEGRNTRIEDPRKATMSAALNSRLCALQSLGPSMMNIGASHSAMGMTDDQEKAALIMQVLQLTDQQIAMLPPDQRQSIIVLKEQLAKVT